MAFQSINPHSGEVWAEYLEHTDVEVEQRLSRMIVAQKQWSKTPLKERKSYIQRLSLCLRERAPDFVEVIAREMGKPVRQGYAEIEKSAVTLEQFSDMAERALEPEGNDLPEMQARVLYEPLGIVFGVLPWNFPIWQAIRLAGPVVLAGNVILIKPSENTAGTQQLLDACVREAGFPEGVIESVRVSTSRVEKILKDPSIAAYSLTGSERAGRAVAAIGGGALKPGCLELGGSDAWIICSDADIGLAAKTAVQARFQNAGQSCVAAKRILVHESVWDNFLDRFVAGMVALRVGDPREPSTDIGPVISVAAKERLRTQVQQSLEGGAEILFRHTGVREEQAYVAPLCLRVHSSHVPAWLEEVFGPIAVLRSFQTIEEAVCLANESRYGLGASLWTHDAALVDRMSKALEVGMVFVNDMVRSQAALPFGGVKASGFGRELGLEGFRTFVNRKLIAHATRYRL